MSAVRLTPVALLSLLALACGGGDKPADTASAAPAAAPWP